MVPRSSIDGGFSVLRQSACRVSRLQSRFGDEAPGLPHREPAVADAEAGANVPSR